MACGATLPAFSEVFKCMKQKSSVELGFSIFCCGYIYSLMSSYCVLSNFVHVEQCFNIFCLNDLFGILMQTIIAEINQKIGAAGVISQECKTVAAQYGEQILNLLLAEVCKKFFF